MKRKTNGKSRSSNINLSQVLSSLETDHDDALDSFISNRLFEAGVWESPRTSDGTQRLRVVEREPERLRICGRIYEIDQTLHSFWLNLQRHDSESTVTWALYFDIAGGSDRHKRNAIDACDLAEDIDWRVVLTGEAEVRDGMLIRIKGTFADAFYEAERNSMGFLESEYAFHVVNRKVLDEAGTQYVFGMVTYAEASSSNKTSNLERFVTLSVAPLRLELDLDIGIGEDRRNTYSICELHSLERDGKFPPRRHDLYEAMHDVQQLQAEFERLAQVLRSCGSRFFAGDMSLWDDLSRQRFSAAQAQEDIDISRDAETAFKAKQWDKVVRLLEPRESRLSKVDAARLSYARKQRGKVT